MSTWRPSPRSAHHPAGCTAELASAVRLPAASAPLRRLSIALLGLLLLLGSALPEGARAQGSPTTAVSSNRQAAREIAESLARVAPALRDHHVHWLLGVDISGSMDALLPATQSVLKTLAHRAMAPQDRITLFAFDDEVRRFPSDTLTLSREDDTRKSEVHDLVRHLQSRPGRKGSAVESCFRQLFEHAAKIATNDHERLPILMLITDRDTSDTAGASVRNVDLSGYSKQFGSIAASAGTLPYVPESIKIDAGGKSKELTLFVSGLRDVAGKRTALLDRQKPVEPPVERVTPASDPNHHIRLVLFWAPISLLLACLACAGWTWHLPAARLLANHQSTATQLRFGEAPLHVPASRNTAGLALDPARSGLGEPQVLQVRLGAMNLLRGGTLLLSAVEPYQLQDSAGLWEREITLPPRQALKVRVRDTNGEVAHGDLEWHPLRDWRLWLNITLVLLVLSVLLVPADYLAQTQLAPPIPEQRESIRHEPL